jgi:hypothetical protein
MSQVEEKEKASVLIWCRALSVLFGSAESKPAATQ